MYRLLLTVLWLGLSSSLVAQTSHREDKSYTLALTGDIMMGTTFPKMQLPPFEGRQLFVHAAPILKKADFAAGNLEGPLCDEGETDKKPSKSTYAFRTPTCFAPRLREAGFDFLSLANNHAMDFGIDGAKSTMQQLRQQRISFSGIKGYASYAIVERNGVKFGVCAFGHNGYTYRHQEIRQVREIITQLCSLSQVVVVTFHGGAEGKDARHLPYGTETFYEEDRGSLREFAHFCIDAGADVVFGHGPHVARAVEVYKHHFIAYSLGNFCTPYGISLSGISGYAPLLELKVSRDGRFLGGKIHSFIQRWGVGPRLDSKHHVAAEIAQLTREDITQPHVMVKPDGTLVPTD